MNLHFIPAICIDIAELIKNNGGKLYLVGGAVRDLLLGIKPEDCDLEVFNVDFEKLYKLLNSNFGQVCHVGKTFGVLKLKKHKNIDISIPRKEEITGKGHRDFNVKLLPTLAIKAAAERRDFTINAILLDPLTGELKDPYHGYEDLQNKILRHTSKKFSEDPLRVLRGMQFIARFNLSAAKETVEICKNLSPNHLSRDRIFEEFKKLFLNGKKPSLGFEFLKNCDWVKFFPGLETLAHSTQWEEAMHALDKIQVFDKNLRISFGLTILGYFLEKHSSPFEKFLCSFVPKKSTTKACKTALLDIKNTEKLLNTKLTQESTVDWLLELHAEAENIIVASKLLFGNNDNYLKQLDDLTFILKELNLYYAVPQPIISGKNILQFGVKDGPEIKKILKKCLRAQLLGKFSDPRSAKKFLANLLK